MTRIFRSATSRSIAAATMLSVVPAMSFGQQTTMAAVPCSAASLQTQAPPQVIQVAQSEAAQLEGIRLRSGVQLSGALARYNRSFADFGQGGKVTVSSVDGLSSSIYAFQATQGPGAYLDGLVLIPPVPDQIQDALREQGIELPWLGLLVQVDRTAAYVDVWLVGTGERFRYAPTTGQATTVLDSLSPSNSCIDCIIDLIKSVACEAIATTVACVTVVGCPGGILSAIVKAIIPEALAGKVCLGANILKCGVACFVPRFSVTPASDASVTVGNVPIDVTISGNNIGSWVAAHRLGSPSWIDYFGVHLFGGPSADYHHVYTDWVPTPGTWTLLYGNVPNVLAWGSAWPWMGFSTNITVKPPTYYSISGNVTVASAAVTAGGKSTTSDSGGNYTLPGFSAGSYTVTAAKTACTFSPTSRLVTIPPSASGINFTATCQTYSISGNVGVATATVTAGGKSTTSDSGGKYALRGLSAGTHTVTPSKSGHTFSPSSRSVTLPPSATGVDFTATAVTHSIGGNAGTPGATVAACGKSTTSDSSGNYTLSGFPAGSCTVTASKSGCSFSPTSRSVTLPPSATGISFTASCPKYSIAGNVGTAGATVSVGAKSVTSGTDGAYSLTDLPTGTYTWNVSKSGCTFTPSRQTVVLPPSTANTNTKASCTAGADIPLTNNVVLSSQSVQLGYWRYYYLTVPSGRTKLTIQTTGATADIDLYALMGSKPTFTSFSCRPYRTTGDETCTYNSPSPGTWWFGVFGFKAAKYSIKAVYQ